MSNVSKDERVLLVIANLSSGGDPKYQWLYQWLDSNAVSVAKFLMKSHYRHIDAPAGSSITSASFVSRIKELAQDPQTKALDVFLILHGSPGKLYFNDVPVNSSDLKAELQAADLKHRLRLFYSTACYGATHAPDFVGAGFRVASGAKGVCTNGPYDYPAQLLNWAKNKTYRSTVKAGNNSIFLEIHDAAARAFGFTDVDSEKIIVGKKLTRITSEAV